ncbi:MAG: hypothetical protein NTZ50_12580 [Chloroflexi bacterium]|nr:hypothetical protein [Chloroflexota bacterium]
MTNPASTERRGRRSVAVSVFVGIILLTIPCYLLGFGLLWIARPVGPMAVDGWPAAPRTTATAIAAATADNRPPMVTVKVAATAANRPLPPTVTLPPTATVTATPKPTTTEPLPPTETPTEVIVVPLETATTPPEPTQTPAP